MKGTPDNCQGAQSFRGVGKKTKKPDNKGKKEVAGKGFR